MNEKTLEQARCVFGTMQLLRGRLFHRHLLSIADDRVQESVVDLTMPQMSALLAIRSHGRVSIKELAEALCVSAPSASAMVERLVEASVVSREQNRVDRREVTVQLTEKGREAMARMERVLLQSLTEVLEEIGPDYAAKWCDVCARIRDVLTTGDSSSDSL